MLDVAKIAELVSAPKQEKTDASIAKDALRCLVKMTKGCVQERAFLFASFEKTTPFDALILNKLNDIKQKQERENKSDDIITLERRDCFIELLTIYLFRSDRPKPNMAANATLVALAKELLFV